MTSNEIAMVSLPIERGDQSTIDMFIEADDMLLLICHVFQSEQEDTILREILFH